MKNRCKKTIFYGGVEVVIFGQSKNGEFSIKRHKTLMFHRSEPNFVSNENLDHSLSDQLIEADILQNISSKFHLLGIRIYCL